MSGLETAVGWGGYAVFSVFTYVCPPTTSVWLRRDVRALLGLVGWGLALLMLDLTKEWFAVVRNLRQQQQQQQELHLAGTGGRAALAEGYSSGAAAAAEALVGSRWRTPLSPFMQQVSGYLCGEWGNL